jgi:multiple sugar transport system ATP-binding protein
MATVQLRGLGKTYPDGHVAVRGVDLDIADGEFFVLVGPSGCGKTSVLRMIAGLEEITTGRVLVDGVSIAGMLTRRRNLAMLFQSSALYPNMTVRENLAFPLQMAHLDRRTVAARVAEAAHLLGLDDRLDSRPGALSGGERQRVAMGRAFVRRPDLMLMDEPMSNLDAKLRTALRSELLGLQRRLGVTTVYVTHDQVEAMSLGDRVAVMRAGRIVQCATPLEIYERPVDMYVGQFIGSPPMNLLRATLVSDATGPVLQIGSSRVSIGAVASRWPGLEAVVGSDVVVGIRPDAFRRDAAGEFELSVRFHEQVGSLQWVHALVDAPVLDAVDAVERLAVPERRREPFTPDQPIEVSDDDATIVVALEERVATNRWAPLRLSVQCDRIHLFDAATGLAFDRSATDPAPGQPVRECSRV